MLHLFDRLLIYGRGGNFVTFLQYIDKVLTQHEQTEPGDIVFSFFLLKHAFTVFYSEHHN